MPSILTILAAWVVVDVLVGFLVYRLGKAFKTHGEDAPPWS